MGMCTPRITPWSVADIRRMEPQYGALLVDRDRNPMKTGMQRSPMCKSWHTWRNSKSNSKWLTRKAENITTTTKVTTIPTLPEVLGLVVPGNIVFVIRNLKLKAS